MNRQNKGLWIGTEEFNRPEEFVESTGEEFFELPILNDVANGDSHESESSRSNRRDFLKYLGFGVGAAVVAASCETPIRRALPYAETPDQIVPGVATYYASSYIKSGDFCPIVVKTREGRPIKIEGNKLSELCEGGTSARVQAYVLELYDRSRIKFPGKNKGDGTFEKMSWDDLDKEISTKLMNSATIRIVTHTQISPSQEKVLDEFIVQYPNTKVVVYDPVSASAQLDAQEISTSRRMIPDYHFDKAKVVVNFGADFLGTWISPIEYSKDYGKNRRINNIKKDTLNRMVAFESGMSFTGSNADSRVLIKPSEQGLAIAELHNRIAVKVGYSSVSTSGNLSTKVLDEINVVADDLLHAKGQSLVVSGSNNVAEQLLVNHINEMLGNVGKTLTYKHYSLQKKGNDKHLVQLLSELKGGSVDCVVFLDQANPIYDTPEGKEFKEAIAGVPISISTSSMPSETLVACKYSAPTHHGLESWGDAEPKKGEYYLSQPTISPLFDTREQELSLLRWGGLVEKVEQNETYYQYVRNFWKQNIFPQQTDFISFESFWNYSVHNGYAKVDVAENNITSSTNVTGLGGKISSSGDNSFEISFYENINIGNGNHANNPWLQEMPDPLLRTVWDNFVCVPIHWDGERYFEAYNGLENGDLTEVIVGENKIRMTAVQAFGQKENTAQIALGYGRTVAGKAGEGVGVNVYPLLTRDGDGYIQYYVKQGSVSEKVGEDSLFASVQYHHTYGLKGVEESTGKVINVDEKAVMTLAPGYQGGITDRTIIRHANEDNLVEAVEDLRHEKKHAEKLNSKTLYPGYEKEYAIGHKWGMSIDLTSCTGCGACQVACIAENNVPIVGKKEVHRHHEMTWLRIDRYFYGDSERPNVVYQPMICQHCDNAPCENVCPVNATNHSTEGINQMVYNRCIGTRYCANNCPYKVRRFNWLDYTTADLFALNENHPLGNDTDVAFYADNLTRMVLNPDVTVRSRGVMEKCSFCVQRIQEGKLTAKRESRKLVDGDVSPACATACPTGCIVFGDTNDLESKISQELENPLSYQVLMEINTRPAVTYKMKVVNKNSEMGTSYDS